MAYFRGGQAIIVDYIGSLEKIHYIRDQFCGLANSLVCFKKQLALESVFLTRVFTYLAYGSVWTTLVKITLSKACCFLKHTCKFARTTKLIPHVMNFFQCIQCNLLITFRLMPLTKILKLLLNESVLLEVCC